MNSKPSFAVWCGNPGQPAQQLRVYWLLETAMQTARSLDQAGYEVAVEEVLDYDLGKIVWSSGSK